ncbi:MAG: inverse autotransporter beta domain-containing protein, partial [Alphaproteobacteria bacterium]|nr:inverse autotransporter beta domain-containing protein [Alphaproteobacteria bacterium]
MSRHGGLSGRANLSAIGMAILAMLASTVILSGPQVVRADDVNAGAGALALTTTDSDTAGDKKKKKDTNAEDGLLLRSSDPLGLDVPKEITAQYGISGAKPTTTSETDEAQDYVRNYADSQIAKAEARIRSYTLDLATNNFQAAGQKFLGERFQVFSSLVWTEKNQIRGAINVVAPLRESERGVTFLQPGIVIWNGKDIAGSRDSRTDFSLGLVHRIPASGGGYFGGSVFYDSGRYSHQRLGLGLDYQIHQTRLSANYYLPLSESEQGFRGFRERALRGYDFSFEQGYGERFVFSATGGIWESTAANSPTSSQSLLKASAKYFVNENVSLRGGYEWAGKGINSDDGYNLGVDVHFPGGGNGFRTGFQADPWAPVKRESRILVTRDDTGPAARDLASGGDRDIVSVDNVASSGINRPASGSVGAHSVRVTLGPGARVYYAVNWEFGRPDNTAIALEGGDPDIDDWFAHSVTGDGTLNAEDGGGNCITVEQSTENSVFDINFRVHGKTNAAARVIHMRLTPVAGEAACIASSPGGAAQALSSVEVGNGVIDVRIPLNAKGNIAPEYFVRLSSAAVPAVTDADGETFRVFVSDAIAGNELAALPADDQVQVALAFSSLTETLGDTYTVTAGAGATREGSSGRWIIAFSGETTGIDFTVGLGEPKRSRATVRAALDGFVPTGGDIVPGFGTPNFKDITLTATVTDPVTAVYFSEAASSSPETGSATIRLARAPGSPSNLDVGYEVIAGTATAGDDYTEPADDATVRFDGAGTTANITVPLTNDSDREGGETFTVRLVAPSANNYELGAVTEHVVTITDDDTAAVSLSANRTFATEGATGASRVVVTATRSGVTTGALAAPILIGHASDAATLGAVADNGDYSVTGATASASGGQRHTLNFTGSSTTATVTFDFHDDDFAEGDENITVRLARPAADAGYAAGAVDTLFLSVIDGDKPAFRLTTAAAADIREN